MPDRFEKFSERARKVLTLAQEESERLRQNYIGTEHLLLGLLRVEDGVAAEALRELGISLNRVRSTVEFIIGRGDRMVMGEIGLTPRAKKVIELAVDEARCLNHHYIGTEHLLLGLVREGEGIAAGLLTSYPQITLPIVRQKVLDVLSRAARQGSGLSLLFSGGLPLWRDLPKVVSIGQVRAHLGLDVTLLSIELYAEGFLVNGRMVWASGRDLPSFPEPGFSATDDHGHTYEARPMTGSGDRDLWRFTCAFMPALDSAATRLTLEVVELLWAHTTDRIESGTWTFAVQIPSE